MRVPPEDAFYAIMFGMVTAFIDGSALRRFRSSVAARYGDRLERIVLYGSRARGDWRDDSDYDVAVFLHDLPDWWEEAKALADISTEITLDTGEVVNALPFRADAYSDLTPLMHEIRHDGQDL